MGDGDDDDHELHEEEEEEFDILTKTGLKTGFSKPRSAVHRDGDYHRAVHVWIFAESTQQLLLQKRTDCKDSWPGLWDISSAGHVSAGDTSLITARRELKEELGVTLPNDAFELLFVFLQECVTNDGKFIDNEFDDVYLVTTLDPIPMEAFTLHEFDDVYPSNLMIIIIAIAYWAIGIMRQIEMPNTSLERCKEVAWILFSIDYWYFKNKNWIHVRLKGKIIKIISHMLSKFSLLAKFLSVFSKSCQISALKHRELEWESALEILV